MPISKEHEAITQELSLEEKGEASPQEPSSALRGEATPQEPASPKQQEQGVTIFPKEHENKVGGMDSWVKERIRNKKQKIILILLKQNIRHKRENK